MTGAFTELAKRLSMSRHWVGAQFGWVLVWIWVNFSALFLTRVQRLPDWYSLWLGAACRVLVLIAALAIQAGMLRCLMKNHGKHVRPVWGALALFLFGMFYSMAAEAQDYLRGEILKWLLVWVVMPAIFFPFAAAANYWGWRLPWRRVLQVVCAWRWWLCVLLIGAVEDLSEIYSDKIRGYPQVWDVNIAAGFKLLALDMLEVGVWVLLLGWLAVLFDMDRSGSSKPEEIPLRGTPIVDEKS